MGKREHKQKPAPKKREEEQIKQDPVPDTSDSQETGEKLKDEMDEVLDEIDEVLEENAEDFVNNYVQKGGQ